jgi:hypothetical protein
MQQDKSKLFKVNSGLGYQAHTSCTPLQSQEKISPQVAIVRAITPQQVKAHIAKATKHLPSEPMEQVCKRYPASCNSDLAGPKWAGIL